MMGVLIFLLVSLDCIAVLNTYNNNVSTIPHTSTTRLPPTYSARDNDTDGNEVVERPEEAVFVTNIQDMCIVMEISPEQCSCSKSAELCEHFPEKDPVTYIELREADLAVAGITTTSTIIGVLGNALVLRISFKYRAFLTKSKMLIAILSFTDFISSLLNLLSSVHLYWTPEWVLGSPACAMLHSSMHLSSWLSAGFILIIAVERYFGILYPMRRELRRSTIVYGGVGAYIIVATVTAIPLFINTSLDEFNKCSSGLHGKQRIIYQWFVLFFYMVVPIVFICSIYIRIILHLVNDARCNALLSREMRKKRKDENRRTVAHLMPILIAFVMCVLPTHVVDVYLTYRDTDMKLDSYVVLTLLKNLAFPLHSCVNPLIYTAVDRRFRHEVLVVLRIRHHTRSNARW